LHGKTQALLVVICALALPAAALADREQVHLTAAGQSAARAAVLTRADLGPTPGWVGGAKKPSPDGMPPCAGFDPRQSDLVRTGAAEAEWKRAGLDFDSEAQVLATPRMVMLDWQRTVLAPQVVSCMRSALEKKVGGSARVASVRWVPFPKIATYTRALRIVLEVSTANGAVPVLIDVVLVGRGRTEVTLTTTAPLAAATPVRAAEVRLATILASRIRA
jgi:hypothetical protein